MSIFPFKLVASIFLLAQFNLIPAEENKFENLDPDNADLAPEDPDPVGYKPYSRDSKHFNPRRLQGRIAGGRPVEQFQIPNQLYIHHYNSKEFICGAALINVSGIHVAVTAAHCIWAGEPDQNSTIVLDHVEVVAGATNRVNQTLHEQRRNAKTASIFPNFDPDTYQNDIAVVFIDPNFVETRSVLPADLPEINFNIPAHVEISGWGSAEHGGNISDLLKFARMPAIPGSECAHLYKLPLDDRHFCGKPEDAKGACFGDFGGPAMVQNISANMVYLGGIMSRTIDFQCGNSYKPTVFVRVAPYMRWIKEQTEQFKATLPPDEYEDDDDGDASIPP